MKTKDITIVCSRSVGHSWRAEVYVMMECSYFAVDGMPIEMYGKSWIWNDARNLTVLTAHSWHELYGSY